MMIEDFITNGKFDEAKMKTLCRGVPYKSEIIWENDGHRQTKYSFENGLIYAEDDDHTKFIFTEDGRKARFRADNSLECLAEADNRLSVFRKDGTCERILFAEGSEVRFYEDGKSVSYYLTIENKEGKSFSRYLGRVLADYDNETLKTVVPLVAELQKTEVPPLILTDYDGKDDFFVDPSRRDKGGFVNDFNEFEEISFPPLPKGYKAIYTPFVFTDDKVPAALKNIGVKIHRGVESVFVDWDEKAGKKIFRNEKGEIIKPTFHESFATVRGKDITIHTARVIFTQKDFERMREIEEAIYRATEKKETVHEKYLARWNVLLSLPDRDRSLYTSFENAHCIDDTLYHELKHIFNHLLCDHRAYASDYKNPMMREKYLLKAENERTATLNSLINNVNAYLEKGDYKDFSSFSEEFEWVSAFLEKKSVKEIQKICYPPVKLMNMCLKKWNDSFLDSYFQQFQISCDNGCTEMLLTKTDKSGKEYEKQRSLMYTFELFNPHTQKKEMRDLSSAVKVNVPISEQVQKEIIEPCLEKRFEAQRALMKICRDKYDEELLRALAVAMRRSYIGCYKADMKEKDADIILKRAMEAVPVKKNIYNRLAYNIAALGKIIQRKFAGSGEMNVTALKRDNAKMLHSVFGFFKKNCTR